MSLPACGSRGLPRPLARILGSVSSQLVGHAPRPVLVVSPAVSRDSSGPLGLAAVCATGA